MPILASKGLYDCDHAGLLRLCLSYGSKQKAAGIPDFKTGDTAAYI